MQKSDKEQTIKMFAMKCEGKTYQEIADAFGITKQCVQQRLFAVIAPRKRSLSIFDTLNMFINENKLTCDSLVEKLDLDIKRSCFTNKLKGRRKFNMIELKQIKEIVGDDAFFEIIEYYTDKEIKKQGLRE